MVDEERIPPQNLVAEQSVLGSMLIDKGAVVKAIEILRSDSFYRDAHRFIFEAILNLFDKNEPVDSVTLTEMLRSDGKLDAVGGSVYIADLINSVPTAANVEHYARIVEEKATLRRLIDAGTRIVSQAFNAPEDIDQVLDKAEKEIFGIALKRSRDGFNKIEGVLKEVLNRIDKMYDNKESVTGTPSGFSDLDAYTAGFQNSDLIVIAGRPGMGKTSFALNIAENCAINDKVPVAVFSLEMSKEQLVDRLFCSLLSSLWCFIQIHR